jgi:hypothetical protein
VTGQYHSDLALLCEPVARIVWGKPSSETASELRWGMSNHKSNSAADTNARDSAIVCSIALQYGADLETIRRALCRDSHGNPSGPLGTALDLIGGRQ